MSLNTPTDLRRRPEQERSKDTVNTILEAAKVLFGEQGIDTISMTQIAKQAGMSKPALYRYFPNKQSIIRELADNDFAENRQLIAQVISDGATRSNIVDGIEAFCQLHIEQPYRSKLRAAIHADPALSDLDMQDSRHNAAMFTDFLLAEYPHIDKTTAKLRALLLSELFDSLVRLIIRVPKAEGRALIEEYVDRFTG